MRLLITDPKWTWREWLKANQGDQDVVCLDVADADHGPPARAFLLRGGKVREWRLVGSIYANRNPNDLLIAAAQLMKQAKDPIVVSFEMRESPVHRHMALSLAELIDAKEVLVPEGSPFIHEPWPVEAKPIAAPKSHPQAAVLAHRRSRWLELIESCQTHTIELDHVSLYGVRLGAGRRLHGQPFDDLGIHVEIYGQTLLIVSDKEPDAQLAGDALNLAHASKIHLVSSTAYEGLVCSFVRGTGEDFGMGVVVNIDFEERRATILNNAVAPAPVRMVRIGSTRIDDTGKETGETKPWAV